MQMNTKTSMEGVILTAVLLIMLGGSSGVVSAAEPTASAPIRSSGQATTLRASGSIDRVSRQGASITFFADAPFWGPPRYGAGQVMLWPKDTAFVLFIPGPTPIRIDGKKASFRDLAIGQKIEVQYNLQEGGVGCIAHRIDAHAAPRTFTSDGKPLSPRLVGHWRQMGSGYVMDYWFTADGTFRCEVAEPNKPLDTASGTWSITGDRLDYNVIKSNHRSYPAGTKDHDKLLQLTKDYYVLETRRGNQHRFVRLPQ
jgi:hypothetical protein